MKKRVMKNNLFWLLFGSTAIGLSICGLALYFSILFAMAQDQILDFADDAQEVREYTEEHCGMHKELPLLHNCISELRELSDFVLSLTAVEPSFESEEVARVGDKRLYDYAEEEGRYEGFLATMPMQFGKQKYWLTVRDSFDHVEHIKEDEEQNESDGLDIALAGAFYGVFLLLFILAIFLYFPVRKLNRWIAELQYASEQISKQNYEVRLTEYKTQPLANLASSFNGMAEKIEDHIRDKNILANAIAHELRTPLTRFRLALGLLQRQPIEGLAKELVSDLERYTDDLEMITDNTLRLATLRDSKINLQTIKLSDFIDMEGEKFRSSFPQLTITVSSEASSLKTDIGFLQLALDNLLSNACHYAESSVSLKQWKHDKKICIEVCDDGSGIPEEDVEYIQQAFTRLDKSRNRATGGTGLGLAIVRIAVQRLEGELIFQPAAKGTRILLSLPIKN
jgi:signal transduction histidine kinase